MIADRRLYIDRAGRLVAEDDPEAAVMLCAKGREIEPEDVRRLGLRVWSDGRVMQGAEPAPEPVQAPEPAPVVPAEPLADVVQPAGKMEEPKPRTYTYRRKAKE